MLYKIAGSILVLIGGAGFLFFSNYNGSSVPLPNLWLLVSILIALVGFAFFLRQQNSQIQNQHRATEVAITRLQQTGENILVDLTQCEILSNHHYQEVARTPNLQAQAIQAVANARTATRQIERHQSRIKFEHPATGELFFSPTISKDVTSLTLLLHRQGTTNLWIDPENRDLYYFDLGFLYG